MLLFLMHFACNDAEKQKAQVAISSTEINFGEVPVGSWLEDGFIIENTGEAPIQILSSGFVGASEDIWTLTAEDKNIINSGEYVTFLIRFSPDQMREEDVRIQIRLDMEDMPTLYVNGYGSGGLSVKDLDEDGYSPAQGDCNDANPQVFPDANEICDAVDNNCDGILPDDENDLDGDGWLACVDADGLFDCDDQDNERYPGAPKLCDGKDNDCDGLISDDIDQDGDGQTVCENDCDDFDPDRWYGTVGGVLATEGDGVEDCDFKDNDCNGIIDDIDNDADGFSPCPSGGDCDDGNPMAYPVIFDSTSPYENGDGSPEAPYKTLSAALQNMDDVCKTVMVNPGTHEVGTTIAYPYSNIRGAGQYPDDTILVKVAGTFVRPLTVRGFTEVELSNLTFYGSDVTQPGAAIYIKANSNVVGEDLHFLSNESTFSGGAVSILDGSFSCTNCDFSQNASDSSGGAVFSTMGSVTLDNVSFYNNQALQGSGGAVAVQNATLVSVDNHFQSNAADEGGAVSLREESVLNSTRDIFWDNEANSNGGSIALRDVLGEPSIIVNGQFQDNLAYGSGGAIYVNGGSSSFVLGNSTFLGNYSVEQGGDLYVNTLESSDGIWVWSNLSSRAYGEQAMFLASDRCSDSQYLTEADCLEAAQCSDTTHDNQGDCQTAGETWTSETWIPAPTANFSFNSCHLPSQVAAFGRQACYQIPDAADSNGNDDSSWFDNHPSEPLFQAFVDDESQANDNLDLQSTSVLRNTGPVDGIGAPFYNTWSNPDGSRNHRGHTGGPSSAAE